MNYHHLYYFFMVCKEGGYSKAALKLRVAQSAVSHQVSLLEDFLGEKLMIRGPRGFTLTEAGQVALAEAEGIFRQGEELLQYFRSGQTKATFRIGSLGGLSKNLQLKLLQPLIEDNRTEISLEVGDPQALVHRLMDYKLDAILSDVPFASTDASPLMQKEIDSEPICLVGKKPFTKSKDLAESLLHSKGGVFFPSKGSPVTTATLDYLKTVCPEVNVRGFIDDIALLRLLALESEAWVVLPKIGVQRELQDKKLFILHEFKKTKQSYYLVFRQKGKRHPAVSELLKWS